MAEHFTHLNERGEAHMVDVGEKSATRRRAVATGFVEMRAQTLASIRDVSAAKGDVLAVARVAGIMAAKRTSELIPLCHQIALTRVTVDFELAEPDSEPCGVAITAAAECLGQTGVEMEALTAASVAGLTIYDMCKAIDRGMVVTDVALLLKEGGKSGRWDREQEER